MSLKGTKVSTTISYHEALSDRSRDMVKLLHWSADTSPNTAAGSCAYSLNAFDKREWTQDALNSIDGLGTNMRSGIQALVDGKLSTGLKKLRLKHSRLVPVTSTRPDPTIRPAPNQPNVRRLSFSFSDMI